MLTINLLHSADSIERYLNRKAKKGYHVKTIVPFALFPPLYFTVFNFSKTSNKDRVYRVDSRKLEKDQEKEYYQIFADDGWKPLGNGSASGISDVHHIFYSDDPKKNRIYSDEESVRQRDKDNAGRELLGGLFLFVVFICLNIFFPILAEHPNTPIGFLSHNFYFIVAIGIIIISLFRYFKNR